MRPGKPPISSDTWLTNLPDPVPDILARGTFGWIKIGAFAAAIAAFAVFLFQEVFLFPTGWFCLVLMLGVSLPIGISIHCRALGQPEPVLSALDFLISTAWRAAKCLILASLVLALLDLIPRIKASGAGFDLLPFLISAFWKRVAMIPDSMLARDLNLLHLAGMIPLISPLKNGFSGLKQAIVFSRELAAGKERRIQRLMDKAGDLMEAGQQDKALASLKQASGDLAQLLPKTTFKVLIYHRRLLREKMQEMLGRPVSADFKRDPFGDGTPLTPRPSGAPGGAVPHQDFIPAGGNGGGTVQQQATAQLGSGQYREFVESLKERAEIDWKDIAGLDDLVAEIKSAFAMALASTPQGVQFDPPRRILLYGPPGTGKTLVSAAVSNSIDASFYNIKVSDILSKFFGESTRLLNAMFEIPAETPPAVLFFDEIESICANRDAGGMDGEERRMISALLAELDGLKTKGSANRAIFTIAATNMPWSLDPAILSRFEKQFFIPLPDQSARRRMIQIQTERKGFTTKVSLDELARFTRGYSGREIRSLCQESIRLMMLEANPGMLALAEKSTDQIQKYEMKVLPLKPVHWNSAFQKVRPQTSPELLARYSQWRDARGA